MRHKSIKQFLLLNRTKYFAIPDRRSLELNLRSWSSSFHKCIKAFSVSRRMSILITVLATETQKNGSVWVYKCIKKRSEESSHTYFKNKSQDGELSFNLGLIISVFYVFIHLCKLQQEGWKYLWSEKKKVMAWHTVALRCLQHAKVPQTILQCLITQFVSTQWFRILIHRKHTFNATMKIKEKQHMPLHSSAGRQDP